MNNDKYIDFLKQKVDCAKEVGVLDVSEEDVNSNLYPHQRDAVLWAVHGGRRALFESFGLGKTIQQLEICRILTERKGGKALIVCPLGVKQEFTHDAEQLLEIKVKYVRNMQEVKAAEESILLTNYERVRDGDIDPLYFTVTSLDEASVLRSYGSKTYQQFLRKFKGVPYKYVCTATPSPNKYKELIHYAGYLEIMDTGQALTRFFKRDSTQANNLTIYPHKEKEFWIWMSSWALFITKPSDLGYSDDGYDLPDFKIYYHKVDADHSTAGYNQDGQKKLFRDAALGLKDAAREKRDSIKDRIRVMIEILKNDPENHYILWHDLEAERHAIKKAWPQATEVYGSQDLEIREQRIIDFSNGKIKYLATKPEISGSGCNFQRYCHKAIFLGIGYKFNDFIQAIHRIHRFLQEHPVEIHIIYSESEEEILKTLNEKWEQHKRLVDNMRQIILENGLANVNFSEKLARYLISESFTKQGKLYKAVNNDCVVETSNMERDSVDLVITSIPFSNHYEYTPTYNDFGHTSSDDHFFNQMDFLTPELLRVLKPGRVACIHVKDRILFGNVTGFGCPTVNPFHMKTTFHFLKHGFLFMGMVTIETDVVRENNQTYRLGWSEQCKDGSKMGVGSPEYLLIFRKKPTDLERAYADTPVEKSKKDYPRGQWQIDARAKWNSSGNRILTGDEIKYLPMENINDKFKAFFDLNVYDYKKHVETAVELEKVGRLPATFETLRVANRTDYVWEDINRMLTLNSDQSKKNLEMHICPLQFDIVDRCINRFSNKKDIVYDPFAGLFTVPYRAILMNRIGVGCELNPQSFYDGLRYLRAAEESVMTPTLFDLDAFEQAA